MENSGGITNRRSITRRGWKYGPEVIIPKLREEGLSRLDSCFGELELEIGFDFDSRDPAHSTFELIGDNSDSGFGTDDGVWRF